ncbi:serine/threonine protein kinase [Nocardia sp. 2]|uniref:non-specific serine/threonine protein kinase n=1 Tax=Nocardia acididurans TaxID=2802282 RepID=A0ABS1M065_9NOCA|nr:serine/threonine-protein kinase [Nocardia acididurans]MBL1073891.1 serine/threonine protein kinase [Nocardia acididurans]
MELAGGMTFAGYTIERKLGAGSSGAVYLAQHPRLPRKDALKILAEGSGLIADLPGKFLREADLAARLHHPNLVAVRDRGFEQGRLWIAMQYVDGPDLAALIRHCGGGLDPARAVAVLEQAAHGIDEIHGAGLLHRDVKPANILVAAQPGGPDRVYVTDFGIARAVAELAHQDAPDIAGTLAYAAPEQIRGETLDHLADVYALGCTLFHALTGAVPFPRGSTAAILYAQLHESPPRPSERNPVVPHGLDAVVAKAMAKDPADRYASCGELAAAARAVLESGSGRRSVPNAGPRRNAEPAAGQRVPRRRRVAVGVAVVAAIITLVSAGIALGVGERGTSGAVASANTPVTGTIDAREWGELGYIASVFPDLLPPTPTGAGYQDLSGCFAVGEDQEKVYLDTKQQSVNHLYCMGDLNPVWVVTIACNADRTPILPDELLAGVEGHETWSRASGTGNLFWGKDVFPDNVAAIGGKMAAILDVYFDDPGRNFCRMRVFGDLVSGSELRSRWWLNAPV